MKKIIAFSNQKGGVGKTTAVINLGAALAQSKKKVLLIDLDPQSHLSQSLGHRNAQGGVYNALQGDEFTIQSINKNLSLLPSCADLAAAEVSLASEPGGQGILREVLEKIKDDYDFIFIDCPPSLGLLTLNAFTAADGLLIPLQAHFLALSGMAQLVEHHKKIKSRLNPQLELVGVLLTFYDKRKTLYKSIRDSAEKAFPGRVFQTAIRDNVSLAEAPSQGTHIFEYAPKSNGAIDYLAAAKEFIKLSK
jgi:chromosome partitioning protein